MAERWQVTDGMAGALASAFYRAEIALLDLIATNVAEGITSEEWAAVKARQFLAFHDTAANALSGFDEHIVAALESYVEQAARDGIETALGALPAGTASTIATGDMVARVLALTEEHIGPMRNYFTGSQSRILRAAGDVYRRITAESLYAGVTGVHTRRQITQDMLNRYADEGIAHFMTVDGKRWHLDTYAEMTARTGLQRVSLTGSVNTWTDFGYGIVRVTSISDTCSMCGPYQDALLAVDGQTGRRTLELVPGEPHTVTVRETLTGAMSNGLFHPNCRHSIDPYIPGYMPAARTMPNDAATYAASQEQRYLERQARKWDRRAAAALTPDERARAENRRANYVGRIETLVKDTPDLFRLEYRESAPVALAR